MILGAAFTFALLWEIERKNLLGRVIRAEILQDSAHHFNAALLHKTEKCELVLAPICILATTDTLTRSNEQVALNNGDTLQVFTDATTSLKELVTNKG
jgi:hypothetical protein